MMEPFDPARDSDGNEESEEAGNPRVQNRQAGSKIRVSGRTRKNAG